MTRPAPGKLPRHLAAPAAVLTGVCLFALLIHAGPYRRIAAIASLSAAALIIASSAGDSRAFRACLGLSGFTGNTALFSLAGALLGLLLALYYRGSLKATLLPHTLTVVAVIAPLIGITEELLFRGYLQGKLAVLGSCAAVILSALAHTLYKYLVLRSLPLAIGVDFPSLAVLTFGVGLIYGFLRVLSRSVIPACVSHALFDVLVYGGLSSWPVWVWN